MRGEDISLSENNKFRHRRTYVALLGLALALVGAPLPILAQATSPAPVALPANTAPTLVSLLLLVIGLVAVGLVALRVTGLPAPGTQSRIAAIPEDDELIQDQ